MSKASLSPRNLSSLFLERGKQLIYKNGEIILRPDDTPSGVYYIEKGFVKVYSITQDGDEKLHIIYKSNQIFPLMWALEDVHKDVYYEALGSIKVTRISKEIFKQFIEANPYALKDIIGRLVLHFNIFVDRVDNLEITKAYPRLVACLFSLANRFGRKSKKGVIIDIPIAQKDIANSINMSRETASREIEKLEKKGLISYKNHLIFIKNIKNLEGELFEHYEREPM